MQPLAVRSLSVLGLVSSLAAQGILSPTVNDPNFGATIITVDSANNTIQRIEQIELRHMGSGLYRTVVTAQVVGATDTKLVAGLLGLASSPPTWIPTNDLDLLNVQNTATDEFQGSMSADGLTVVWDNYNAATTYPNAGPAQSFICHRANTSVQFQPNDVRAIANGTAGGMDPHIAQDVGPGLNPNILLSYLDASSNISKCIYDPLTGAQVGSATTAVVGSGLNSFQFCHSSFANRDSTGKAVSMGYSEYHATTGNPSDAMWTEDLNNTGTPSVLIQGTVGGVATWYANPAIIGGTFVHACARGGYIDPTRTEANMVANADLRGAPGTRRIVGMGPIRPTGGVVISIVGLGVPIPLGPTPPVIGNIDITPIYGILPVVFHNPFTGLAEWNFGNVPLLNQTWSAQIVTLDGNANLIYAGNVAQVFL